MILSFEFQYISKNAVLENFLKTICDDFKIEHKISKEDKIITLFVNSDEEQLGKFSDFLSKRLPLSIFFKSSNVTVVKKIKSFDEHIDKCNITLPYSPQALNSHKTPFEQNEVGLYTYGANSISLEYKNKGILEAKEEREFKVLYKEIAKLISEQKCIHVNLASGTYCIGKIDENFKALNLQDFIVMPTDLSVIEKMVVIKDNEIKALASIEKPAIELKVNSLYQSKEILQTSRVKIKLSEELFFLDLCKELYKIGIDFIYRSFDIQDYDYTLKVNGQFTKIPQIEVCVLENGEILILKGDGYAAPEIKENLKKFNLPAHAQFASIIQEHNLFDEKVSCFYISKSHNDLLMQLSTKTGMLNLVHFPIMYDYKEIFEKISSSDESGSSLIENYKKQYSSFYEAAINTNIPKNLPNSVYSMLGIASIILGISHDIKSGSQEVLELAQEFGGQKGPRIDFLHLEKNTLISDFDFLRFLRSLISFKLAGTDDMTLSFGILESLAYFLVDNADSCRENLSSSRILLCGSMFGIKKFSELSCKHILANGKISFNIELPIDN